MHYDFLSQSVDRRWMIYMHSIQKPSTGIRDLFRDNNITNTLEMRKKLSFKKGTIEINLRTNVVISSLTASQMNDYHFKLNK